MKNKEFLAIALVTAGALIIYAGMTGYHLSDALRVITGKSALAAPRAWFGVTGGLPTPGAPVGSAPLGYNWSNGYLVTTDASQYPDISQNDSRYKMTPNGQRYISINGQAYYDNTVTNPGGPITAVPNTATSSYPSVGSGTVVT